jgi:hypothetical protein
MTYPDFNYEELRRHIEVQLTRIASESRDRLALVQAEIDRRFASMQREDAMRESMQRKTSDERYMTQTKATDAAFAAQQTAMRTAFEAADKAVQAALAAAKEATNKFEEANNKRFDSVNEFRAQLADQTATLLPRSEYTVQHQSFGEKIDTLGSRMDRMDATQRGIQSVTGTGYDKSISAQNQTNADEALRRARMSQYVAIASVVVAIISIVVLIYLRTK